MFFGRIWGLVIKQLTSGRLFASSAIKVVYSVWYKDESVDN